jgi:hypothetical protein
MGRVCVMDDALSADEAAEVGGATGWNDPVWSSNSPCCRNDDKPSGQSTESEREPVLLVERWMAVGRDGASRAGVGGFFRFRGGILMYTLNGVVECNFWLSLVVS